MRGAVSFTAAGFAYKIAFTTSAMIAYEEKYDESFLAIVEKFDGEEVTNLRISFLVELFEIGLRACKPDLATDAVSEIVDAIAPKQVIELIGEAIRAAFPDEKPDGKKPRPARSKKKPPGK